jgi:hypothetical protein
MQWVPRNCFNREFSNLSFFLQVFDSIMNYKKDEAASLMQKLNIELKPEDRDKDGKALLKVTVHRVEVHSAASWCVCVCVCLM